MSNSNDTPEALPEIPASMQKFLDDTMIALRIHLMGERSPRRLKIRFDTYPSGMIEIQQDWGRPKTTQTAPR